MRIAILGAGFAGLATCWHLLNESKASITVDVYDPLPIGKGVSGFSSGLLHLYTGKHARRAWGSGRGIAAAHELLTVASHTVHQSFVLAKEILRPAITEEQIADFKKCAQNHEDTEWWPREKCLEKIQGLILSSPHAGGLLIKNGLSLDVPRYLEGIWQACVRLGAQYHHTSMASQEEFEPYDRILFAMGQSVKKIKPFAHLPITPLKGQLLELAWPTGLPPLPLSLVGEVHIVMRRDHKSCLVGSTYERTFKTEEPVPEVAIPFLREKLGAFFPELARAEVHAVRAGVRASTGGRHLPLIGRLGERFWIFTGMGSKGLLYHAWLGKCLAQAMLKNDPTSVPKEVWHSLDTLPLQS